MRRGPDDPDRKRSWRTYWAWRRPDGCGTGEPRARTRVWDPFAEGQPPLELPLYAGRIAPERQRRGTRP
ncbi:hypothetical protein QFZ64_006109 [Streptomyces sp. B3I8]|nr:hypothetical protein [Streptomyces sp. B3I8]